jgi:hypothetical protein
MRVHRVMHLRRKMSPATRKKLADFRRLLVKVVSSKDYPAEEDLESDQKRLARLFQELKQVRCAKAIALAEDFQGNPRLACLKLIV